MYTCVYSHLGGWQTFTTHLLRKKIVWNFGASFLILCRIDERMIAPISCNSTKMHSSLLPPLSWYSNMTRQSASNRKERENVHARVHVCVWDVWLMISKESPRHISLRDQPTHDTHTHTCMHTHTHTHTSTHTNTRTNAYVCICSQPKRHRHEQ